MTTERDKKIDTIAALYAINYGMCELESIEYASAFDSWQYVPSNVAASHPRRVT